MDKREIFIKNLIKSNFIGMLKNRDRRALEEFKSSPNSIRNLIIAMGAENKILESPAHLQMLEEIVGEIAGNLGEALEASREECGYSVEFDEQDKLTVRIETFASQDDFKLSILEDGYNFESSHIYSGIGRRKRIVHGDVNKKQILDFEDKENLDETKNTGKKLLLDDSGFVIDELSATKTTNYKRVLGSTEREKTTSRAGYHISRDGAKVTTSKSSVLDWNADPLHLNDEEVEKAQVYKRAIVTMAKCPKTQKYYEDTLEIDFDKMLEAPAISE